MNCQIEFTSGSRQGEVLPIKPGNVLTVGRSRTNAVQLSEMDVSGEHMRLDSSDGRCLTLENLSRREGRTRVNGTALGVGEKVVLRVGDEVAIGNDVHFRVVSDEEGPADGMATRHGTSDATIVAGGRPSVPLKKEVPRKLSSQAPGAASAPSAKRPASIDVTMIQGTMQASDEELEKIKADIRAKQRWRVFLWVFPTFLLLATLLTLYVVMRPKPEEYTSWPTSSNGSYIHGHVLAAPYLAIVYPGIAGSNVSTNEPGKIVVRSALGQLHDIPLQIIVRTEVDPATLEEDHRDAFDKALRRMSEQDTTFSAGVNKVHRFIGMTTSAGVPISYLNYTRRQDEDEFFGYLVFLRQASTSFTISLEVPLAEQWRTEAFLRSSIGHFVIYAQKRIAEHWEGCSWYRRNTTIAADLEEAKKFLDQKAPVHWEAAFMRIESALVKAAKARKDAEMGDAVRMLASLREAQTVWYNQQKLSYLESKVSGRKDAMLSIQSLSESAFTPLFQDFDFRYELIKRREWR